MKITFLLPGFSGVPVGGFKVVFELSNRLCAVGHEVTVVFPRDCRPRTRPLRRGAAALWAAWRGRVGRGRLPWFELDPRVARRFVADPRARCIPDGDALVATAWDTADWVANAPPAKGRKLYLIQHFETWGGEARVRATWRLPLDKIVVSRWLMEIAESMGVAGETTFAPLGLDFAHFRLVEPIDSRKPRIGMLHHTWEWKGSADGIAALEILRARHPSLAALLFGTARRPPQLPAWIDYVRMPDREAHVRLYNSCNIFVQPSWSEGWGLPATEAMMCGCALVTTDNGGSRTYARHGETALVTPPRDPGALARSVDLLLRDDELRRGIARAGHQLVQQFTWERMVEAVVGALGREATATRAPRRAPGP